MQKFVLATKNEGKIREMQKLLSDFNIKIISLKDANISLDDVYETGKTFEENAIIKAKCANKKSSLPSIADDSGLLVDALNGEPGIFSARYASIEASDGDNIKKLLLNLQNSKNKSRKAHFVCAICVVFDQGNKIVVRGECDGEITKHPIGEGGFGYDPVFMTSYGKTFAEISQQEKNKISHRGKAIRSLIEIFKTKRGQYV